MEFPKMLYRGGTMIHWAGRVLDWCIVDTPEAEEIALAQGWTRTAEALDHDGDGRKGGGRKRRTAA